MGQGQRSGQSHRSRSSFWSAAVDIRGSALPSAAKSNNTKFASEKSHYQYKMFVSVSVISSADAVDRLLLPSCVELGDSGMSESMMFWMEFSASVSVS